ncbi:CoA pyrophosphatase [Flavobacteriaceae bacterium]|nr:CoA pyrophosphatase [Flavobacteriaceae bacterium]
MLFTKFESLLPKVMDLPLPGIVAQKKMAPLFRLQEIIDNPLNENKAKKAAVLILFFPDAKGITNFVLIERVVYSGVHSGQISFPGGKRDFGDNTFWDTALREAQEEVGITYSDVEKIKELSRFYIPPSNFIVHPFVGFVRSRPIFVKEIKEVEKIIEVPLSKLLDSENETKGTVSTSYVGEINVPMYVFENVQVWGATATILAEMKELILIALKE